MFLIGKKTVSPAVAYMTKVTLLSMSAMILCLVNLIIQAFFRSVFSAIELLRKEAKAGKEDKEEVHHQVEKDDYALGDPLVRKSKVSPLEHLYVFFCIRVTVANRMSLLKRLIYWNPIVHIIFTALTVSMVLAVILY